MSDSSCERRDPPPAEAGDARPPGSQNEGDRPCTRSAAPSTASSRPTSSRTGCAPTGRRNHERVLHACEAAVHRLDDRPALLRPAVEDAVQRHPGVLPDVRAAATCYRVVDRYLSFAAEYLATRPTAVLELTGQKLECRATTRKGTPCQRMPLPHNGYCPSHQHLVETEEILTAASDSAHAPGRRRRRHLHGRRRRRRRAGWSRRRRRRRRTTSRRACSPPSRRRWSGPAPTRTTIEAFAHGTTVATNALLEGDGARTVLVATARLRGRRRARPPGARRPLPPVRGAPGAARAARAARGRARADDARRPARRRSRTPAALAAAIAAHEPEAVAVCLLHAYRHPEHEQALGEALAERLPGVHVSLCHDVVGTFREYERAATTEIDAALSPLLAAYLRCARRARAPTPACPTPDVMQSSGGLATLEQARAHAALTVLSGPAGGAAGAAWAALAAGEPDALCFDMGGTSCDVCVIEDGSARETGRPPRRRAPDRAADARPPHGRRRRRLDRVARRGRRPARRAAERRRPPGPGRVRPRRRRSRR